MEPPDLQTPEWNSPPFDAEVPDVGPDPRAETQAIDWLAEIVCRLEEDPEECWPALESLSVVDDEVRVHVIAALASHRDRPGVAALLNLLGAARDPCTRSAAARVLAETRDDPRSTSVAIDPSAGLPALRTAPAGRSVDSDILRRTGRIARSLVTALDGQGRGTIVLSICDGGYRRTAAFRCDVRRGILDATGEVEAEHASAGRLVDEWLGRSDPNRALDVTELAVRLLEGCWRLSGSELPSSVRAWLVATIGPVSAPIGPGATLPGPQPTAVSEEDLARSAERILDACPDWLDLSTLTAELAVEIALREGFTAPDPVRDAGAYRYLFEHLLIHRLELYSRMLLWMGWVWRAAGRPDLSHSAFVLAAQLSDDQYAVPSHPFTVALTTRSFRAAQAALREMERPAVGPR
jgi:hypothetical protein